MAKKDKNHTLSSKKWSNHNGGKTDKYGGSANDNDLDDDDMTNSSPSAQANDPPSVESPPTAKPASPPPFTAASDDFPSLPPAPKEPAPSQKARPSKKSKKSKSHKRDPSDEPDYEMIDPSKDTELGEEGVLVDATNADEEFEMVPKAKDLPREDDLEDMGKPFAGQKAWDDAIKAEEEGKGGDGDEKDGKAGSYWSREGDAKRAGK